MIATRRHRVLILGSAILALTGLIVLELQTSWAESRVLAAIARRISFIKGSKVNHAAYYVGGGPYDERLGYSLLPGFLSHLKTAGFHLESQARASNLYLRLATFHIYPIYREKAQAGLEVVDRDGSPLYLARYPEFAYDQFTDIPPLIVNTLLFLENRELLDQRHPYRNPAIGWSRLSRAAVGFGLHAINHKRPVIGGSTLATQLEKMRHSPGGRTHSVGEKLRQITAASLRSYLNGPQTMPEQQRIVQDYINSLPLASAPSAGEVTGLGDGLAIWYGADLSTVNSLLNAREQDLNEQQLRQRARAYREVLSLLLALRAPAYYLIRQPWSLETLTDRHLRAIAKAGIISNRLGELALAEHPNLHPSVPNRRKVDFIGDKAPDEVRSSMLSLLGLKDTYALDRLDLTVHTTIDGQAEQRAQHFLKGLNQAENVEKAGLVQYQLLEQGDPRSVIYSFVLYEHSGTANLLRIQTDSYDQPLNINNGTKLQLGSTAKLRTLINYLQVIETLYNQYRSFTHDELSAVTVLPEDHLTAWAVSYLEMNPQTSLNDILRAALNRTYSAEPLESFFTAGGLQSFANFDSDEDSWNTTVSEGFEQSVNLIFIRVLRDIEYYYLYRVPGASPAILRDANNPERGRYLDRFADEEGRVFLSRFYDKYRGSNRDQILAKLIANTSARTKRTAALFRLVQPKASVQEFGNFLRLHTPGQVLSAKAVEILYNDYGPDKYSLIDRAYLAQVHPLELWLVGFLWNQPQATFGDAVANSADERRQAYEWLLHSNNKSAQDRCIRIILEQDAFREIWYAWKQVGYPFSSLVPSYATAIGVSGDTPEALTELMGIVANQGVRYPNVTIDELHFAQNTPGEAVLRPTSNAGQRVLSKEITTLIHQELLAVVEKGTARRAQGGITLPDGTHIPVGGKTGTGDNRFKVFSTGGAAIDSRAVNRTAVFAFTVGDRFFGTILAFVPGKSAEDYAFTSALAVQAFKDLEPTIKALVERREAE